MQVDVRGQPQHEKVGGTREKVKKGKNMMIKPTESNVAE